MLLGQVYVFRDYSLLCLPSHLSETDPLPKSNLFFRKRQLNFPWVSAPSKWCFKLHLKIGLMRTVRQNLSINSHRWQKFRWHLRQSDNKTGRNIAGFFFIFIFFSVNPMLGRYNVHTKYLLNYLAFRLMNCLIDYTVFSITGKSHLHTNYCH